MLFLINASCPSSFDWRKAEEAQAARGEAAAEPRNGHAGQGRDGGGSDNDVPLEADVVEDSDDGDDEAMPSVVDDVTEDAEEMIDQ